MRRSFAATYAAAAAGLIMFAASAQATILSYTSQAAYLAAVGTTVVDTFDDLQIEDYATPLVRSVGGQSYTITAGPNASAVWGAGGPSDYWLTPQNRLDTTTFTFGSGVAGAGGYFFGSDLFGSYASAGSITITATDSDGNSLEQVLTAPDRTSFLGFVSSSALTSLAFSVGNQVGIWATINDLQISSPGVTAVPEPATFGTVLGGLGVMAFVMRRRKQVR